MGGGEQEERRNDTAAKTEATESGRQSLHQWGSEGQE